MSSTNPLAWEDSFPAVYTQTSTYYLKKCSGFCEAKNGDFKAAINVSHNCINPHIISEIKKKYPDAILLPVITNNKLPVALARTIGMNTHTGVYAVETQSRKSLSAMGRLLHRPLFYGSIIRGKSYILVDDVITQGGTVSALRKHVITNGGYVAAIVTLSCSVGSNIVVPNQEDIHSLIDKFSLCTITNTLRRYNIAQDLYELTRSQIKYLLQFKQMDGLINKIEETRMTANLYKN